MSVHNLYEYKKAGKIVEDLEKVLKILNTTQAALSNYEVYKPVQSIINTIHGNKAYIELFHEKYKIILQTKGEKGRL